jgi:hypothetical protein
MLCTEICVNLRNLWTPLFLHWRQPVVGLRQPVIGLRQPVIGLRQPVIGCLPLAPTVITLGPGVITLAATKTTGPQITQIFTDYKRMLYPEKSALICEICG